MKLFMSTTSDCPISLSIGERERDDDGEEMSTKATKQAKNKSRPGISWIESMLL
jgi:hypothetical protein